MTGRPAQVVDDPVAPDRAHVRAEGGGVFGAAVGGGVPVLRVFFLVVVSNLVRSVL